MTVEIIEFIDSLDRTNPKGSDPISEGDDHVRNIKAAIVDTFPNITGEVTASHEEINQLVGLEEIVSGALPDQPTEESSLLHNEGGKWKETTTIKIAGDKAFIPALAGLGNVNLYINNNGEIVASEQSTDPTWLHGINTHTDVNFDANPVEDDVMIFDGTSWKSKKLESGNTMNPLQQPKTCGNFSAGYGAYTWEANATKGTRTLTFTVPAGLKFYLKNISSRGSPSAGGTDFYDTVSMPLNSLTVDGVKPLAEWAGSRDGTGILGNDNDPMLVAKVSVTISYTCTNVFDGGNGKVAIAGYFVEDR
jgi:hypothetical protein